jgi:aspartate/methionine/tyrosine aminotransferase
VAHAEALRKLEARSRARAIVVPTAVDDVKARLRELGHPVTLFGENHVDRRERLREAIASLELNDEELAKIQELINQGATAPPSSSSSSSGPDGAGAGKAHETSKKEVFYSPAAEALIAAHRKTPLAGLLVASPANPTGTMMEVQALSRLISTAEGLGIKVISDEIYHGLDYAFAAETAAKLSDRTVIINSFSKYFCMTGWRVGWMVLPPELVRTVERLQQNFAISVPTLSQIAAEAAFDGRAEMEEVKHGYEENRRILTEGLPKAGLDNFLPVDGAFYLYANIAKFSDDSLDFTKRMLNEAHVAATPGLDFDPIDGRHYLRFCYSRSRADMHEAVRRIGEWLKR